jgi:hypothetical protein
VAFGVEEEPGVLEIEADEDEEAMGLLPKPVVDFGAELSEAKPVRLIAPRERYKR